MPRWLTHGIAVLLLAGCSKETPKSPVIQGVRDTTRQPTPVEKEKAKKTEEAYVR